MRLEPKGGRGHSGVCPSNDPPLEVQTRPKLARLTSAIVPDLF